MAVNLASKYSPQIDKKFVLDSFVVGKVSTDYDFVGVNAISIYTPVTKAVGTYTRSGENRFGTVTEMQDTVQVLTLTQDISWTMSIDKGNNEDQLNIKGAGKMLQLQLEEQVIPTMDQYALKVFSHKAGQSVVVAATTTANIIGFIMAGLTALRNKKVPLKDLFVYVGATVYGLIALSTEVMAADPMASEVLGNGVVGKIFGHTLVVVPDDYLPTGVKFMIMYKGSGIMPRKIRTLRILTDVQGIDGAVLEGRDYYDAFVLGNKANGIYVGVLTANKTAVPVITNTSNACTVGAISGVEFKYTVDGSDPRYSSTAVVYSGEVTLTTGQKLTVFGRTTDGTKCWSDLVTSDYA
jgi:hypothetical protein